MEIQALYQKAITFATLKHLAEGQTIPGSELPYVVHLSNVAMEILMAAPHSPALDLALSIQLALLHDVLEDTTTTAEELRNEFGADVAEGVLALTKKDSLPKEEKMRDSLNRILQQRKEVWAVKLADRITNLQAPPQHWTKAKIIGYQQEAKEILDTLNGGNAYLEARLTGKIAEYNTYIKKE